MPENERCKNCRFWDDSDQRDAADVLIPLKGLVEGSVLGDCRRFPPSIPFSSSVQVDMNASHPMTWEDGWCGEWQAVAPGGNEKQVLDTLLRDFLKPQSLVGRVRMALALFRVGKKRLQELSDEELPRYYAEKRDVTVRDLLQVSQSDLMECSNFGPVTLAWLVGELAKHGLELRP